jgi:hypothetical protein
VRLIAGTSDDDSSVTRVRVAVSRRVGHGKCVWLGRGSHLVKQSCRRPLYLNARLLDGLRWTLRVPHLVPRGTWTARSLATDDTGLTERLRKGRNVASFRLR